MLLDLATRMRRSRMTSFFASAVSVWLAWVSPAPARAQTGSFPLVEGDVVVTLGDSNTAPGTYQRVVERFTAIRFPGRSLRYINMGIGGDTAAGGLARLQRDVFDRGATVLFVTYGINDICWGLCADDAHKQTYYDAIIDIIQQCASHGVRVYVTTYPYTGTESPILYDMTLGGVAIAQSLGQHGIDVYATMKSLDPNPAATQQCYADAQQCPEAFRSACSASCNSWAPNDGVHLGEKAQRAWAYALLQGLGAPATVSSATLDAPTQAVVSTDGATVTNVRWNAAARRLTFNRLDEGQPLTFASNTETYFNNLQVPFHRLGSYLLKVTNLPAGTYRITIAGQQMAHFTHTALANPGVNLVSAAPAQWSYGVPWMFQNSVVDGLTTARSTANRVLLNAAPGSAIAWFLGSADALVGYIQRWAATPLNSQVVIEPAP